MATRRPRPYYSPPIMPSCPRWDIWCRAFGSTPHREWTTSYALFIRTGVRRWTPLEIRFGMRFNFDHQEERCPKEVSVAFFAEERRRIAEALEAERRKPWIREHIRQGWRLLSNCEVQTAPPSMVSEMMTAIVGRDPRTSYYGVLEPVTPVPEREYADIDYITFDDISDDDYTEEPARDDPNPQEPVRPVAACASQQVCPSRPFLFRTPFARKKAAAMAAMEAQAQARLNTVL